jgi:hypothetical protein
VKTAGQGTVDPLARTSDHRSIAGSRQIGDNHPTMQSGPTPPDSPRRSTRLRVAISIALSFSGLVIVVVVMLMRQVISFEMAMLMLVALLGLYVGFGVLIAVYHLIGRLE